MGFAFTRALGLMESGTLTGDVRGLLVMSNTTADTEPDVEFLDDITTLDEYDGSGYAREVLTSESFAVDLANNRFDFSSDPIVFAALGVGTRQCVGLLLYLHVTNDADSKPLFFFDGTGFPFDGAGGDVTMNPHADGLSYLRNAV